MRTREITNTAPNRGYGKFAQTSVDGRIYGNRSPVELPVIMAAFGSLSSFVSKQSGVRKTLRHDVGALGFQNVSNDELANAKKAIHAAKDAKNNWYNGLSQSEQQALGSALIGQNATKTILTMAANRAVGLDATFGILDVSNDAALKVSVLNTLNRISGNAFQVESIQDRDIKAVLEGMSSATALQLVQYKHWNKLEKSVDELSKAVGTSIEKCINAKVTGIPAATAKHGSFMPIPSFVGGANPGGSGRVAAEPLLN